MRLAALALATTLTLAACGSEPAADTTTVEAEPTVNATNVEVANSGGEMATLPDYVPLIPGGQLMMAEERGGVLNAAIQAPGSVADTAAFYESTLKNNGMNPAKQTGTGDGVQLTSTAKGRDLMITVGPAPNGDASVGVVDRPGR